MNTTTQYQENRRKSLSKLQGLMAEPVARQMLRLLLDDIRLRFELVLSPVVVRRDGEMLASDTIRKGAAYEIHNLYAALLEDDKELLGAWLDL